LRDGTIKVIKAETLVVGDIVSLTAGGIVPADIRLFDGMNLSTDEALLTGESLPISKHHDRTFTEVDMPVGDRTNICYCASMVARGRGTGMVIAIGMLTEVGSKYYHLRHMSNR
jgi:P-type Na+/K+ transporter